MTTVLDSHVKPDRKDRPRPAGTIGENLRELRKARNWTIDKVAKASDVSAASISRIENGRLSPTYEVIVRLAEALEVDIRDLFYFVDRRNLSGWRTITQAGAGKFVETPNYRYELLCHDVASKAFLVLSTEILNRSMEEFGELQSHSGQEQLVVTQGAVEVHTEHYAPVILKVGDSISYDSNMGHAVIAVSEEPAKVLWIHSYFEDAF